MTGFFYYKNGVEMTKSLMNLLNGNRTGLQRLTPEPK